MISHIPSLASSPLVRHAITEATCPPPTPLLSTFILASIVQNWDHLTPDHDQDQPAPKIGPEKDHRGSDAKPLPQLRRYKDRITNRAHPLVWGIPAKSKF